MRRGMKTWLVLIALTALPLPACARTLLVLGDSLSAAFGIDPRAGWVALLEARLERQKSGYTVVNASISGDTTANGLARLPALLKKHNPEIVVVALGGNDGLRGFPPAQTKHNIATIVEKAKAAGAKVLLLGVPLPPNYGRQYIEKFVQTYRDVAREQNVPLVESMVEGVGGVPELMQSDDIHPNAEAQPKILENVWPRLAPLL